MNEQQKQQLKDFLAANQNMFAKDIKELGRTSVVSHTIDTEGAMPVKQRIRNMNPRYLQFIKQEVQDLLAAGLIEPSYSPWASLLVIVEKKNGKLRMYVDYRELNKRTKIDVYPLPKISEMLEIFREAHFFSILDIAGGYWQLSMSKED